MKTTTQVLLFLTILAGCFYAQAQKVAHQSQKNIIPTINEAGLNEIIQAKTSHKKIHWFILFTSGCGGTSSAIEYAKEMNIKFGDSLGIYFLAGNNYSTTQHVAKLLEYPGFSFPLYIIDEQYGTYKDERKKCMKFRNAVCTQCKSDVIGVPYNIVYNTNGKILFNGFKGFRNSLPSDFITHLMKLVQ